MHRKAYVIAIFALLLFAQGCNTFKGAAKGFKEDWKVMQKTDDWIRENLW